MAGLIVTRIIIPTAWKSTKIKRQLKEPQEKTETKTNKVSDQEQIWALNKPAFQKIK